MSVACGQWRAPASENGENGKGVSAAGGDDGNTIGIAASRGRWLRQTYWTFVSGFR